MAAPDLSALTTSFVERGGPVFARNVLNWRLRELGIEVRTNVKAPQALTKLSAVGGPRPYRSQDDLNNNPKFDDRVLSAFQSKWDYDFDSEEFRNTYLANDPGVPFYQAALNQTAKEYLDQITRLTLWLGVRNAGGAGAADLCDGWGTIIANEITATNIDPVVTGAITSANAVDKVEAVAEAAPQWMRDRGFIIFCSYSVFDLYKKHYRATYNYQFQPREANRYMIDGFEAELRPVAFMGTSQRLAATLPSNFVFGTDVEAVQVAATQRRNIIEVRQMMPVGCQIKDLEALVVNDQA